MPLALDVLLPLPLGSFRYLIPPHLQATPLVGSRVAVPWQGGLRIGVAAAVVDLPTAKAGEYREVTGLLDEKPFLAQETVGLLLELSQATATPPGSVLATFVPRGLREELHHEVRLSTAVEPGGELQTALQRLSAEEWRAVSVLSDEELERLREQGLLIERARLAQKTVTVLAPGEPAGDALAGAQQENQRKALEVLEELGHAESGAALAARAGVPVSAVRALVRKGFAHYTERPLPPPQAVFVHSDAAPAPDGAAGLDAGQLSQPVTLVGGATRRERLAAIAPVLMQDVWAGSSVLVLVPEGAYLNETAQELAGALPVLSLSGQSTDSEWEAVWREAAAGTPLVLVATYGALFAPLPRLARLVVLEAASGSYKLQSGPRSFVPSVARLYAQARGVPLVLADVLPSPEMEAWGAGGRHLRLPLPGARYHVSDLEGGSGWPLGTELVTVLKQVAQRERQGVLLAPRRGFSAAFGCESCGSSVMCPNCDLALRYHQSRDRLRCHQCGYEALPPDDCPSCGEGPMRPERAAGTEWVATALKRLLPDFPVYRLDADRSDDLTPLYEGEPGIVVATTALFRRRPLPNVSLLAVTLLDTHLNVSDFRAAEESLRLLLQLPELAPGRRPLTVIQTFQAQHEVLQAITGEQPDAIDGYLERVRERRQAFGYPPFGELAKVQVSARDRETALYAANRVAGILETAGGRDEVLGPAAAPVARVRGRYSFLLYIRTQGEERLRELLQTLSSRESGASVRVDVDPRDVAEFIE